MALKAKSGWRRGRASRRDRDIEYDAKKRSVGRDLEGEGRLALASGRRDDGGTGTPSTSSGSVATNGPTTEGHQVGRHLHRLARSGSGECRRRGRSTILALGGVGEGSEVVVDHQGDLERALRSGSSQHGNARRASVDSIWVVAIRWVAPSSPTKVLGRSPAAGRSRCPERAPQHRTSLAEHLAHGEGDALILLVEGHLGALDGAVRGRHGGAVDGELRGVATSTEVGLTTSRSISTVPRRRRRGRGDGEAVGLGARHGGGGSARTPIRRRGRTSS